MVATTNKNCNASLVYAFLYKLVEVGASRRQRVEVVVAVVGVVVVAEADRELMHLSYS